MLSKSRIELTKRGRLQLVLHSQCFVRIILLSK
jgi:hypothetical protein